MFFNACTYDYMYKNVTSNFSYLDDYYGNKIQFTLTAFSIYSGVCFPEL